MLSVSSIPYHECQKVEGSPSKIFEIGSYKDWELVVAIQPLRGSLCGKTCPCGKLR